MVRRPTFRLQTLFVLVTLFGAAIGLVARELNRRHAVDCLVGLRQFGATVTFPNGVPSLRVDSIIFGYGSMDAARKRPEENPGRYMASDVELRILRKCVELRHLDLSNTMATDRTLAVVSRLNGLRELSLGSTYCGVRGRNARSGTACHVTDHGIQQLQSCAELRVVNLRGLPISDESVDVLASLPQLRYLNLSETRVTDEGVKKLASVHQLATLVLVEEKCCFHDRYVTETIVTDEAVAVVQEALPNCHIQYYFDDLELAYERNGNDLLAALCQLACVTRIGDDEHDIREISLRGRRITEMGARRLASLKSLEVLDLTGTEITDRALGRLISLPALRRLDIGATLVTPDGLPMLLQMPSLKELSLCGSPYGDEVVPVLGRLPELQYLSIGHTEISDDGVASLQKTLPNCTIGLDESHISLLELYAPGKRNVRDLREVVPWNGK